MVAVLPRILDKSVLLKIKPSATEILIEENPNFLASDGMKTVLNVFAVLFQF